MNKPQIRFKGFEDEWLSMPISENLDLRRGLTYRPSDIRKKGDGVLVLRSSNINIDTFVNNDDDVYVSNDAINIPFLNEGDLLFTAANGSTRLVGKHCVVNKLNHRAVHGGFMLAGKSPNPAFTHAWLSAPWYLAALPSFISGGNGALGNLKPLDLLNTKVPYPTSQNERIKIGTFFKQIDEMIAEAEREVSRLEKMKQASLQKFFPRPGATAPEIRFDGFSGDWQTSAFSDVFTPLKNNTLSRACLNYESGTIKNIHYGDVLIKFDSVVDVNSVMVPYINNDIIIELNSFNSLSNGDIIFADTAEDEAVGKCVEIEGADVFDTVSGLHTIAVRPTIEFAQYYLGYFLNSNSYHSQLLPLMQGIKVLSIGRYAMADTKVIYPKSLDEQKAIGEYFRNLDSLLSAKRQKLVKLRNIKQACLDKMFVNTYEL